ncbi:MAG: DUF1365 domain-containing protein [Solirubrobacteraceae bacterium]
MSTASCLYQGTLTHHRLKPERSFTNTLAMAYIDLAELPRLLDGRLLEPGVGLMRFRRSDYHGDPGQDLTQAVADSVQQALGRRPTGPIRLLTQLRSLGHCFNPVSFYYCFDPAGADLDAVLVEVTNTPWGERQAYVLDGSVGTFQKLMHVSPFQPMDQVYHCRVTAPGESLSVTIENHDQQGRAFSAALRMDRVELTAGAVRQVVARYPFATIRVLALIYGHALGLKLAGARVHPHPKELSR